MKMMMFIIGVLEAGLSMASPVKSSLATSGTEYSTSMPTPSYTAADYIQDGLIIMWDGIENAGWGIHDSEATVWKNLMGDSGYDFSNCASWGDSYFDLSSAYVDVLNSTDPKTRIKTASSISKNDFVSVEAVYASYKVAVNNNEVFGTIRDGNNKKLIQLITPYVGWTDARFGMRVGANDTLFNISKNAIGFQPDWGKPHGFSWARTTTSGTTTPVYLDAKSVGNIAYNSANPWAEPFRIGIEVNYEAAQPKGCCGRLYCIRIYNRQLSAEEVEWNFMVDKVRFKVP